MDSQRHLMLTPDSVRREDIATDLGLAIIATDGLSALTPQAVGARCGYTRQAVHQWFGGHQELRWVVANVLGVRWSRWVDVRAHMDGLPGFLPDCDEVLGWCRAWLAVVEHAPRDPRIAAVVDAVRHTERQVIAALLSSDPESDRVVGCHALVEGLRWALSAPEPDISHDRAGRLLSAAVPFLVA